MPRFAALLVVAACGHPEVARPAAGGGIAPAPPGTSVGAPAAPSERTEPSQDERLAAIQKAMNELDEAVQGCWAASAVERFDIEGEIVARIDIAAGSAQVAIVGDTARNPKLAGCVGQLLSHYAWAPPLHGQTIQLPFKFRAPDGQSVIDRGLVPWARQGKVAVAVLLDDNNSGNAAASMFELAIEAGGATGRRIADRAELWYFLNPATVEVTGAPDRHEVGAGEMMYVAAGSARNVIATATLHAVIVTVPGGREGAARAGALPTRELGAPTAKVVGPVHLPRDAGVFCVGHGAAARPCPRTGAVVAIYAEPSTIKSKQLAASVLAVPAGVKVPEHAHATETELLYLLAGTGTMTVDGVALPIGPTSVVQIPPQTKHAFTATTDVRAVQLYTPAGPEQRFKAKP